MGLVQTETVTTEVRKQVKLTGDMAHHLYKLYEQIWLEACYDADSEDSQKFAQKLLPHIQALNDELKFKL